MSKYYSNDSYKIIEDVSDSIISDYDISHETLIL